MTNLDDLTPPSGTDESLTPEGGTGTVAGQEPAPSLESSPDYWKNRYSESTREAQRLASEASQIRGENERMRQFLQQVQAQQQPPPPAEDGFTEGEAEEFSDAVIAKDTKRIRALQAQANARVRERSLRESAAASLLMMAQIKQQGDLVSGLTAPLQQIPGLYDPTTPLAKRTEQLYSEMLNDQSWVGPVQGIQVPGPNGKPVNPYLLRVAAERARAELAGRKAKVEGEPPDSHLEGGARGTGKVPGQPARQSSKLTEAEKAGLAKLQRHDPTMTPEKYLKWRDGNPWENSEKATKK